MVFFPPTHSKRKKIYLFTLAMKLLSLTPHNSKQVSSVSELCYLKQKKYLRVNCHWGLLGRTGYSGRCCCIMKDGWITGDLSTLQFGALAWLHVTGWTNTPGISLSCVYFTLTAHSATRRCWSLYTVKRACKAKRLVLNLNLSKYLLFSPTKFATIINMGNGCEHFLNLHSPYKLIPIPCSSRSSRGLAHCPGPSVKVETLCHCSQCQTIKKTQVLNQALASIQLCFYEILMTARCNMLVLLWLKMVEMRHMGMPVVVW